MITFKQRKAGKKTAGGKLIRGYNDDLEKVEATRPDLLTGGGDLLPRRTNGTSAETHTHTHTHTHA